MLVMLLRLFREGLGECVLEELRSGRRFAARIFQLKGSWPAASSSSASSTFLRAKEQAQLCGTVIISVPIQKKQEPGKQPLWQALSSAALLGHGQEAVGLLQFLDAGGRLISRIKNLPSAAQAELANPWTGFAL